VRDTVHIGHVQMILDSDCRSWTWAVGGVAAAKSKTHDCDPRNRRRMTLLHRIGNCRPVDRMEPVGNRHDRFSHRRT